ncbi:MAG: metalloregulator ArsR/SmtB family transcription factor [Pirellulaceae bacterium]|nr:metalloregulator ArsR/SmtB family transcription factor [Pirellulaceae bacterium]
MITDSLEWLQTLADATRVRLLAVLSQQELSVGELCSILQMPQSTVSRHLKVLSADGWVEHRRDGTNQLYSTTAERWSSSREHLWSWVVGQQENSATVLQDQARLRQVLAQRSRSEAFFRSAADEWDRLRVELFGSQLDAFILAASLAADAVVAELGCGSAPLAQLVSPYVRQVIAVDNSTSMLAAARQRLSGLDNVVIQQASLTELPLEDQSVDVAWLVMVLPYVESPELVLSESTRILKRSAPLVVVDLVPHDRQAYRQEMGHVRLGVAEDELSRWLDGAGMRLSKYHPLPPDPSAKGPALFAAVGHRV